MIATKDTSQSQPLDYSCSDLAVMLIENMATEDIRRNYELFKYALSVMEDVGIDQLRAQLHSGQQVYRYYIGTAFSVDEPKGKDIFIYDKLFYSDNSESNMFGMNSPSKYRLWTGYEINSTAKSYFDHRDLDQLFIQISGEPYGEYYKYRKILEDMLCEHTEDEIQRARDIIQHDWYFITFAGKFDLMYYLWSNRDTIAKRKRTFT